MPGYSGGQALESNDVVVALEELNSIIPARALICLDNITEFIAYALKCWSENSGTLYIEAGSPWPNGFAESFNSRFRDEFQNTKLITTVAVAQALADRWRWEYNTVRTHSVLQVSTPLEAA